MCLKPSRRLLPEYSPDIWGTLARPLFEVSMTDIDIARLLTVTMVLCLATACVGDGNQVDLILYNGKIITVDADDTIAEACS